MRLGLIEALQPMKVNPLLHSYPRRMRLGLIEADADSANDRMLNGYPRRMRLGLIEAQIEVPNPGIDRAVSEAHAPRPH